MNRPDIVIVCEDRAHYNLMRGFLKKRGYASRRDKIHPVMCSGGDGKEFVRKRYASELKALRKRSGRSALIVITDADDLSVAKRKQRLERSEHLNELSQQSRSAQEPVAIFVPKREVENWFHFLDTGVVDEDGKYHRQYKRVSYSDLSKKLHAWCQNNEVGACDIAPPSLIDACKEWKDFKKNTALIRGNQKA